MPVHHVGILAFAICGEAVAGGADGACVLTCQSPKKKDEPVQKRTPKYTKVFCVVWKENKQLILLHPNPGHLIYILLHFLQKQTAFADSLHSHLQRCTSCIHRWCRRGKCHAPHLALAPWDSPRSNSLGSPGAVAGSWAFKVGSIIVVVLGAHLGNLSHHASIEYRKVGDQNGCKTKKARSNPRKDV